MVDIAAKKAEGKGRGYEKWAILHNLKQMAATMSIYEESGFSSPEELEAALAAASAELSNVHAELKAVESTLREKKDLSQMFNLLCERADNVHGGRLPHHVRVLWDEAANTGQVPNLEKLVAVIRSREVSLTLFYQAQSQCKAIYKDNAETIMGNMDSVVFLGGREHSTVKEISEAWLGKQTISMQTDSRSRGQSESYSQNTQRLGRELMTMDELTTMPGDKCILQLRGLRPFFSPKYDLKQHPNYRYTAEADKKNAFDLSRLISRRMEKLDPDERYTVYEADVPEEADIGEDEDIFNYDDLDDPDAFV